MTPYKPDIRKFKRAVWTTRLKYGKQFLKKTELVEAFKMYQEAEGNVVRFQLLLRGVFEERHEQTTQDN